MSKTKTIQDLTIYNEGYKEGKRQATLSQRKKDVEEFRVFLLMNCDILNSDYSAIMKKIKEYEKELGK